MERKCSAGRSVRRVRFAVMAATLLLFGTQQLIGEDGAQQKWVLSISQAITDLGSPSFRTRESASRKLLKIGSLALMPVMRAARSNDPEVAVRAKRLLKRMATDDAVGFYILSKVVTSNTNHAPATGQAGKPARKLQQVKPMAQGNRPFNLAPVPWWRKHVMSKKARSIERNLGFK